MKIILFQVCVISFCYAFPIPSTRRDEKVKNINLSPLGSTSTLNEEGDFLISGINDSESVVNQEGNLFLSLNEDGDFPLSSTKTTPAEELNQSLELNLDKALLTTEPRLPTISTRKHHPNEAQIQVLQDFLSSLFPSLNHVDSFEYAKELEKIGFDPDCESSFELQYDDISFMKRLHRRYFWSQWGKLLQSLKTL